MYHDPIFAKSFSLHERKRIGLCAFILFLIVALSFTSTLKPSLHPLPARTGDTVNLKSLVGVIEDVLVSDGKSENSESNSSTATMTTKTNPTCRTLDANVDYCEVEGDIRIEAKSSTIFVKTPHQTISNSWTMQPYPRKGTSGVKSWTVRRVGNNGQTGDDIPKCTQTHSSLPAILFSVGGFSGNYFHDFSDLIFPIYSTSYRFQKEVHFIATDYKPWWIAKYRHILTKLTKHEILNIDTENSQVHCYSNLIIGLDFHKELISLSPTSSMHNFRQLLRQTYSLERRNAIKIRKRDHQTRAKKPRLMIISRKRTRVLVNEREMSRLARKLGYEVHIAHSDMTTNLSRFAQTVNSCDVLIGVHGAGLTNMIFLPDNAIVIQVVPFGGIDGFARLDFGNPTSGMSIRYLEYKISVNESSLSQQYRVDHPILKDPISFNKKGWDVIKSIYLDKQNVTIDVRRFKGVLAKSLKLLRR